MRLKKSDIQLIALLRKNCRTSLTALSKKVKVAHTTIFDRLRSKKYSFITRKTILLDFAKLDFFAHAFVLLAVNNKDKEALLNCLRKSMNVNSLFKINNGWDVLIECVFNDMPELEKFLEHLDAKFRINQKQVHYVIEVINRESMLTDPIMAPFLFKQS